jgi:hypothetical protein
MSGFVLELRYGKPVTKTATGYSYRGWSISPDYIGWSATSPNYDASWEGEEDGWVSNGECVSGRDQYECMDAIDEWIDEHGEQE